MYSLGWLCSVPSAPEGFSNTRIISSGVFFQMAQKAYSAHRVPPVAAVTVTSAVRASSELPKPTLANEADVNTSGQY